MLCSITDLFIASNLMHNAPRCQLAESRLSRKEAVRLFSSVTTEVKSGHVLFRYLDITEAFVFDGQLSSLMIAQRFGPCDRRDFCLKQVLLSVALVHYTLLYIHF